VPPGTEVTGASDAAASGPCGHPSHSSPGLLCTLLLLPEGGGMGSLTLDSDFHVSKEIFIKLLRKLRVNELTHPGVSIPLYDKFIFSNKVDLKNI